MGVLWATTTLTHWNGVYCLPERVRMKGIGKVGIFLGFYPPPNLHETIPCLGARNIWSYTQINNAGRAQGKKIYKHLLCIPPPLFFYNITSPTLQHIIFNQWHEQSKQHESQQVVRHHASNLHPRLRRSLLSRK